MTSCIKTASTLYRLMVSMTMSDCVPKPLVVGATSLPKSVLSYRWVIHDAKVLLEAGLQSPTFYTTLLSESESSHCQLTSSWHMGVREGSISLWQEDTLQEAEDDNDSTAAFDIDSDVGKSDIWISQCTFTIVNSETLKALRTISGGSSQNFRIGKREHAITAIFVRSSELDPYLCGDGKLTVQVDASIVSLCFTEVHETIHYKEEQKLPADMLPLQHGLKNVLDDEQYIDVTIKSGDKEFKAHKAVLASQSPVFKSMLETEMKEKKSSVIEISDTDPGVISEMLSYLYTGSAPNMETMAEELLIIANKYQILEMLALCEKKLLSNITVANVVDLLILADMHNAKDLKQACSKYIYRNSMEVRRTSQWNELKSKFPLLLIDVTDFVPDLTT